MNRKRLMTILAGAVAAMALHVGPAAALDLDADIDTDDGLKVEAEIGDDDTVKLDPKIKVGSSDGTKVESNDKEVKAEDTTKKVEDTTKKVTESTDTSPKEKTDPTSGGDSESTSGSDSSSSDSSSKNSSKSSDDEKVTAAGDAEAAANPSERAPTEALHRLSGFEFSSSSSSPMGPGGDFGGDVTPAFDLADFGSDGDLERPLIAAPETDVARDLGDETAAPEIAAPGTSEEQAHLATSSPLDGEGAVPAGLKLLAAALLAGTGGLWHVARREVGLR
jgi:hypothetical protein